jgi:predicted PurR-regulated permease PerM
MGQEEKQPTADRAAPRVSAEAVAVRHDERGVERLRPVHLYRAVALAFLLAMVFRYWEPLLRLLLLLYAAAILAVVLNALRHKLRLQRKWLAALVAVGVLGTVGGLVAWGVPLLIGQARGLAATLPALQQQFEQWRLSLERMLGLQLPVPEPEQLWAVVGEGGAAAGMVGSALGVVEIIALVLIIFVGSLFALASPNERLLTPLLRVVPHDLRIAWYRIFQLMGERIVGWAKGTGLAMLAVGTLATTAFLAIGVPNAIALGVLNGLVEFVPLAGPWVGGSIAVLVAFLDDPQKALFTAIAMIGIQQIESNVITPWAMSRGAELHPFVTLFALVLFGGMFGVLGIFLAVPLVLLSATLVQVLWVERSIDTDREVIAPVVKE